MPGKPVGDRAVAPLQFGRAAAYKKHVACNVFYVDNPLQLNHNTRNKITFISIEKIIKSITHIEQEVH